MEVKWENQVTLVSRGDRFVVIDHVCATKSAEKGVYCQRGERGQMEREWTVRKGDMDLKAHREILSDLYRGIGYPVHCMLVLSK